MMRLIQGGVKRPDTSGPASAVWADFGAGQGSFTRALRDLLGPEALLIAVDRDRSALETLRRSMHDSNVQTIAGDFTGPLDLPPLDGAVMANALHWIAAHEQAAVLRHIGGWLRPGALLIIVEYEVTQPRSYIPHPVPFSRFRVLAAEAGLNSVEQIGMRRSPSSGISMVAALARSIGLGADFF
jgi:SAM-dependent methyltransferase